ncbi:MAG: HAD family hydrolase [Spirochaetaceae bacterium]|jgi:putative hydrolase of the HAD superfamily|nr:HAD family hydrolase [Spirochaetaceae bacterium]
MKQELAGIAFDLDGTLYPNYRLFIRLAPFIVKHGRLLWAMGKARNILRAENSEGPFYDLQARIAAKFLKEEPRIVKERLEALIYRGWEPLFRKIKPYTHVRETLEALRQRGFKLGILSDFPPVEKLEYLGLGGLWDTVLCSEETGRLKPDPLPFFTLAASLDLPPERILYVGNSQRYDVGGAKKTGMRTALIRLLGRTHFSSPKKADFIFFDYRQLYHYVIN